MSDANSENEKTTKAVLYLWKIIANLSAGSIIALLFSFLIGYQYERKYLLGIGAQWAFDLLSFNEIILKSFPVLVPLLIGFIIALNCLYNFENGSRIVRKGELWISGIGILLYIISLIVNHYEPDRHQAISYLLRSLSISTLALAAGFVIVEFIGDFRDQELKIDHNTLNTLLYFSTTILFVIPTISSINAKYDLELYKENLVKTCILSDNCAEDWYVVRPIGDKFLVLNFEKSGQKNFRLVSTSDVMIKS